MLGPSASETRRYAVMMTPAGCDWPGRDDGRIPIAWHSLGADEANAVHRFLLSGQPLLGGPVMAEFERLFAERVHAEYAVATSSCTAALEAAYLACGARQGTEVVTSPLTFVATANAALRTGADVYFADIHPATLCMDPRKCARVVTQKTTAIAPVHYGGHTADIESIEEIADHCGAVVIEDAAHAIGGSYRDGAPVGSRPRNLCCFSFGVQKNMTTIKGGMITTGDRALADAVRCIVNQGMSRSGPWLNSERLGFNGGMPDLNAAIGLVQLDKLAEFIAERRRIARFYTKGLDGIEDIELPPWPIDASVWHLFPIRAKRRRVLVEALWREGIEAAVHYPSINLLSSWRQLGTPGLGSYSYAEIAGEDLLSLPCFPGLTDEELQRVVDAVKDFS